MNESLRPEDPPSRLELLGDVAGCQLAADQPDPRGWTVSTIDGWEIGHLRDLVIDVGSLEVRYLLVELWSDLLGDGAHSEVLTSVDRAHLSVGDRSVTVRTDGPDELWLYIGQHYKLAPGNAEPQPAPWADAHDLGDLDTGLADGDNVLLSGLRVERADVVP